jgi:hypothetical protein
MTKDSLKYYAKIFKKIKILFEDLLKRELLRLRIIFRKTIPTIRLSRI